MDEFKSAVLSLHYDDSTPYPAYWKSHIDDLLSILLKNPKEFPENWYFVLAHIEMCTMHTVCDVCNDVPYFQWLRDLRDSFVAGTGAPATPSCMSHMMDHEDDDEKSKSMIWVEHT
jgi:hypothetical protein